MRTPRYGRLDRPSRWPPGRKTTPSAAASCSTRSASAQAATAYEAALQLRPAYPQAHRGRAEALLELKRYRRGTPLSGSILERAPIGEARKEVLAGVYLTRGLIRARLDEARGRHRRLSGGRCDLKPDAATYVYRGWAQVLSEAPLLALHDFEEAIQLQPDPGDTYNGRGYARVKLGQLREAISDAEAGPPERTAVRPVAL